MKNEGFLDRSIRFILSLALLAVGSFYFDYGWMRILLYLLALGFMITVVTGFCSLYKLLDIDTRSDKK